MVSTSRIRHKEWSPQSNASFNHTCHEDSPPPAVLTLRKLSTALSGVWYHVTCMATLQLTPTPC